jgi:dTDP-glucose pyrophosphorylase
VEDRREIRKTYSVMFNPQDNRIHRLIEKPRTPLNSYMGTGNCIFKNGILDYITHTPVNQLRHEKELPDLIQCAIDDGNRVKLYVVGSSYANVNTFEDIKIAQQILAKDNHHWKRPATV